VDRLVYIAASGAQQLLQQQAVTAHNLANASTTGYKAETATFLPAQVVGPGLPTRAYAIDTTPGANLAAGTLQDTGRDLDVAIDGEGFFVVQGKDGTEEYTRNGSFDVSAEGDLITRTGLTVLGDGGPITVPPDSKITIGRDGTVSAVNVGQSAASVNVIGQLKLVKPAPTDIAKAGDGLFRSKTGVPLEADSGVTLVSDRLESSNVDPISAMVDMINLARQFDLQMKLVQNVDQNEQRATELLSSGGS